jgi:hypothetical protein
MTNSKEQTLNHSSISTKSKKAAMSTI